MAQTWSVIRGDTETQISGGTLSYRVAATNIGAPPKQTISTRGVFQNGQNLYGFKYSKRILSLVFFADAATLALADAQRDDIYELWRGIEGETVTLKVVRDDGSVRLIDGEVVNVIDFPDAVGDRYGASQRFAVQVECHNPFWRGQSLVVKDIAINDVTILTYDGQYPTEPIINIIGPITNPVLTQVVTGKKLDFTGTTIAAGDNYLIDTRYGYKTVLDGTSSNRIANLTSDSNLADFTHETFTSVVTRKWFGILAAEANQWSSVAYGNGVWVAVANSGTNRVMRSTNDGATWSAVAAAAANDWAAVAYGNGVWVAVATYTGTDRIMRSTNDGVTWSAVAEANGTRTIAYGNGVWIAAGFGNILRSTNNGVTWTSVSSPVFAFWSSIAYGNGTWIAVASQSAAQQVIRSTNDGVTWAVQSAAEVHAWQSVAYGDGVWIAVGSTDLFLGTPGTNRIMRSTNDGINWTALSAPERNDLFRIAYGNGQWFATSGGANTNRLIRSTDNGQTWIGISIGNFSSGAIAYGDSNVWIIISGNTSQPNQVLRSFVKPQEYTLTGTGTTSATSVTITYNNIYLGI